MDSLLPVHVIYEDNHLLVVEKPVNIPSQQDSSNDPDILTLMREDLKERYNKPGNVYLGLVHRLDRPVGGVMALAKTSKAASRLSEQIRNREFAKEYLAVVHGDVGQRSGTLRHFLLKDSRTNMVKTVERSADGAKEALLEYRTIGKSDGLSLVRINLITGRSHQIRVQFSASGHPLFGDRKYGACLDKPGQQLALWSYSVTLIHPVQKTELTFKSVPPSEFPWSVFEEYLITL